MRSGFGRLSVTNTLGILRSYTYALNPSGHRKTITESTGRTAGYQYDGLYRLTSETIAGATGQNGTVGYTLDKVGNREVRSSSVASIPSSSNTFNSRDWLSGDTFDANGNTTLSGGFAQPDVYDFEDRLIIRNKPDGSSINFAYDADGILRSKTVLDLGMNVVRTTQRLIDTNNHTGYAQVVEEYVSQISSPASQITRVFTYGSDLISQSVSLNAQTSTASYFGYDGLGSVRALTDTSGNITDTWDYDAFGNTVARTGTTDNAYLYRGEQYDADLGMYYLRARFYNQTTGRFWNQDSYEGSSGDPASLHKYLYANADPLGRFDPSGHMSLLEMTQTLYVKGLMMAMAIPRIVTGVRVAFAVLNITAFLASEQYRFVLFNSGPVGAAEMLVSDAFAIASTGTKLMQFAEGYAASQEVLSEASGLISSTANSIQGKYPGALVGIRGSLARGMRFDKLTKGLEPFNESSWDVDAFVVSDQLAAESARRGAFRSNASLSGAEE